MSMSDDINGRSADDIAREVETSRARVTETLDELKARMSPGQLLDEMLAQTKGAGGEFLANAGRAARDNPLPVLLVGAGLALLATSRGGGNGSSAGWSSSRHRGRGYMYSDMGQDERDEVYGVDRDEGGITEALRSKASGMASSVRDTASSGAERASEGMHRVGEAMSSAASSAGEMASSLYRRTAGTASSVRDTLSDTTDYARRAWHDRRDDVMHMSGTARRRAREVFEEQPLVVGALGLVVGAALGAMLPRSRVEDQYLGDAAERTREAAREMAEAGYHQARQVVEDTMRHVTDELSQRGLSTDAVREAAAAAAEKAREAAMRAVDERGGNGHRQEYGGRSGSSMGSDYGRSAGGEGHVPGTSSAMPGRSSDEEGLGGRHRTPSDTASGAPSTRTGPVI